MCFERLFGLIFNFLKFIFSLLLSFLKLNKYIFFNDFKPTDGDLQAKAGVAHRTLLYGQAVMFTHSFSGMVSLRLFCQNSYICIL